MESLRSMIDLLPPRTPSDAKFMAEDKIKELYLSLRFFACPVKRLIYSYFTGATFAVKAFYINW
jgi:hypothetical protein